MPIDVERGIEQFEGDEEIFFSMLDRYEDLDLNSNINAINDAMGRKSWENVRFDANWVAKSAGIFKLSS